MLKPHQLKCEYSQNPVGIDSAEPRLGWLLESDKRGQLQRAYQVLAADSEEKILADEGTLWDSGRVDSERSTNVVYAGAPLQNNQKVFWKVRVWDEAGETIGYSAPASFSVGLLSASDWTGTWIGSPDRAVSSPLLRREFSLVGPVRRATAHISGLGYGELYLNGAKVGDHVLDPATTYYNNDQPFALGSRVLYVSHDVTSLLREGENAVGVMLGHGWFSAEADVPPAPSGRAPYGDRPRLLLEIIVEYADNEQVSIYSDLEWQTAAGPVTYNDYCNGETYDARLEQPGWTVPGFQASGWEPVVQLDAPSGKLVAQTMPPERIVETIQPIALTNPRPGIYVFDLGQAISGWCRLAVTGPAGALVTLKHGMSIYEDGMLDARSNLCRLPATEEDFRKGIGREGGYHHAALQTDRYILKGEGPELWEPRFTLHSFRYIEVTGYPGAPTLASLEGRVVHSDVAFSGRFTCSNKLYNQIHSNVLWTLRASLQGFPQDAAERTEREGWLGDPGFIAEDYLYNFHTAIFWCKWLADIQDSQLSNGDLPIVSPIHWRTTYDSYARLWPDWSATYPIYLWYVYWYYDNPALLAEHYSSLKRLVDRFSSITDGHIMNHGLGDHMEPQPDGTTSFAPKHTPMPLTSTAYHYFSIWVLVQAANLLAKDEDAAKYGALADEVRIAFSQEFLDTGNNQYGTGSQTSNAVALLLDLVPPERVSAVLANLIDDICATNGGHLTTGIIGTAALERVLTRYGRADVMAHLMAQTTFPSWGEQIAKGATTVWETWDGNPEVELSLNMKMFCSTEVFFYRALAGIEATSPGYKTSSVSPSIVGDLSHVDAEVDTEYGPLAVRWMRGDRSLSLDVTVPVNTRSQIGVPKMRLDAPAIYADGILIWKEGTFTASVDGITSADDGEERVTFAIGSGTYKFQVVEA